MLERKAIPLDLKDLDTSKRTAVIAHAHYGNLDRVKDISRPGMFSKSWLESKSDIALYLNHDDTLAPGRVEDVYDEGEKAMTKAWFGTHTLGNDTLLMLDEKVIKWASFGYYPIKTKSIKIKDDNARELIEVKHVETSPLTKMPANPMAGVVSVTKMLLGIETPSFKSLSQSEFTLLKQIAGMDQASLQALVQMSGEIDSTSDLYNWVLYQISRRADMMSSIRSQLQYNAGELKSLSDHVTKMESFCANTKASDDCIKSVLSNIEEAKQIISSYDTADTQLITEPAASSRDNDSKAFHKQLLLLKTQLAVSA